MLLQPPPPSPGDPGGPGFWRQQGGPPPGWYHGHGRYGSSWSASLHRLSYGFGGQLIVIAMIVVVATVAAVAVRRRPPWKFGLDPAATCLGLGSLAAIGVSTLTQRSNARSRGHLQLVPLYTIHGYLDRPADLLIYLGGNIALFMPLGFFIYLAIGRLHRHGVLATAVACTAVSVGVEILQLPIWSRSSDVDDVLTNAIGGLLGALVGFVVVSLVSRRRRAVPLPTPETPDYAVGSRAS